MVRKPIDMCNGPLFSNVVRYTVPIILTGLLQLLFTAADLMVVGQFCGSNSVGAVGATNSIIHLITNLFIGLSVGAGVMVAQGLGAGDSEAVRHTVHTAIPLAMISGLLLTGVGIFAAPVFLKWMNTPEEFIHLSVLYVQVYFAGIVSTMVYNYGASILRAAGDSRSPLVFLVIAGVVNIVLNVFFVTVFQMDVAGVALATALSQTLSAVLVLWALRRRTDACRLEWRRLELNGRTLLRMLRIGLPAGIQGSMFSISNVMIQSSVNEFGSVAVAGYSAAGSLEGFVYITMNALHQTALNFIGQNMGAGNYRRVRRVMNTCVASVAVIGLVMGGLLVLCGRPLLGLYISDSPQAIEYGMTRLLFIGSAYCLCGVMDVITGGIRGLGVSVAPTLITILGVCGVRLAWIWFVLPLMPTLEMVYLSYPISWVLTTVALWIVYRRVLRRRDPEGGLCRGGV